MARRSVQWRHDFSFPGDPPTPMARMTDADDRRALPPRRPAENRLAPRAGEEDFRWLQAPSPGSPESGSGTPSPQLWAQHPHYGRLYPASAGSSPSRAQAIAGYRREMLDLVRGLPEASYELSLRDIVESRGPFPLPTPPPPPPPTQPHATAAMQGREYDEPKKHTAAAAMPTMDDEQTKKQSGDKKQGKARKQRTMRRTRSRSMERSVSLDTGLLIKLFMPLSVGRKQKVSPKPTAPAGAAKESKKKMKHKKEEEEEWWKKSEFSEAGSSSRTSSTGSSNSNGSASRNNGNGRVNGGTNPQAPARSRSRKRIGCYGFFRPNKGKNGVIEE
ncbi:uncharacterized protein LOC124703548 [Lolium rigidum]|uniref:uncharacterized protein LOC124703548 n=1 Tax=Lolium rigidum TaxID=89674 RepID=UPI001F5D9D72|nr:uncharacterized protein LOC124703548 [Lolium rigidum]